MATSRLFLYCTNFFENKKGEILTSHNQINSEELIITQFHDGKVTSKVVNKEDN